jgi:hypothetical protein
MPEDTKAPTADPSLFVVGWTDSDGLEMQTCPLPQAHAEALAHSFAQTDAAHRYWTRPVPWLKSQRSPRRHDC